MSTLEPQASPQETEPPRRKIVPVVLGVSVIAIAALGASMLTRARAKTNQVALAKDAKPVTAITPQKSTFRATRRYVATIDPWLRAKVGPQLVSAYVDTVLFRPGAVVKKGDVLATLDCRDASASAQATLMAARALEAKQVAIAKEAERLHAMLDGGFVSANEAEKKQAESNAEAASILAAKAKLAGSSLEVNDCILKAPFDGEIDARYVDPGVFAKPGTPILAVIDRSTVRISADVPETDFAYVAPGTPVKIRVLATGGTMNAPITRRSPSADPATRTVHFEIDIVDTKRAMPVGTTGELSIEIGEPIAATKIPLNAAAVRNEKATIFVLSGDVAKKKSVAVLGESGGSLFLDAALGEDPVVVEGRALLEDGDRVVAKVLP
ncbi:MAG: efflux RND transporter periplasmic adaptor subunit [Polyangiales bacterium]